MTNTTRARLALGITAACVAAHAAFPLADAGASQERVEALGRQYDLAPAGPQRDALAARIDTVAHQKYASVSRLYWHTTLRSAMAEARRLRRPILHLRLLGRLDEDLSCANSRLFRTTLYANQTVSRYLRAHFVLSWSSERPAPRVTIDYGDGRRIERTTTGNSAHYVLDEHGHVLDVLPGLYAPVAFQRELGRSLDLAARVRGRSDAERRQLVIDHHTSLATSADTAGQLFAAGRGLRPTDQQLIPRGAITPLAAAQRATVTKALIELPDLRRIAEGAAPDLLSEHDIDMWAAAGERLYGGSGRSPTRILDDTSRALVVRLHNAGPDGIRATGRALDAMLARLERTLIADSALNQLRLRPLISRAIVRRAGRASLDELNGWIYAEVFQTSRQDEWLGLLPRDVFTGLPGDGVIVNEGRRPADDTHASAGAGQDERRERP
jgi:hypothetical protein